MPNIKNLKNKAKNIRKSIIDVNYKSGGGHFGGSLSIVEILTVLYFNEMKINPKKPFWEDRDRFVLSKGHASIALYATMAEAGYFNKEELYTFNQINSRLQSHPDMRLLPGLDFSTGSLGQGISGAVGMALAGKLTNKNYHVYCVIGDGEMQEGQVYEALNFASNNSLDNLTIILDCNKLQQYGNGKGGTDKKTSYYLNIAKALKLNFDIIYGNSIVDLINAFKNIKRNKNNKPNFITALTNKGNGISFMEGNYKWHSNKLTEEQYINAINELGEN